MCQRSKLILVAFVATMLFAGCGGGGGYGDDPPPPTPPTPPAPTPPTISLAPLVGATVNRTVTLTANATAPAGVTSVEFLVDDAVVGTTTTSPYTFAWDTSAVADGEHRVAARVTDAQSTVITSSPTAVTVNNNPTIGVTLSPDEVFPRPTSTASGSGELTFNLIDGAVSGGFAVTGIAATMAHIHQAYAGAAGGIIVNFVQSSADPARWDVAAGSLLTAEQIDALLAGSLYVNVHSTNFPEGEIRGQIQPDNIDVVFTAMSGDQVVPPVSIDASGVAATTIDSTASNATVHANTTGVDDATEAHVHEAAAGATTENILLTLVKDSTAPGHWSVEQQPVTAENLASLAQGGWYIEVHTPANPAGAIRGQITPDTGVTLTQLQSTIFTPRCVACHTGGGSGLPASMDLSSSAASFAALVNVPSIEQPTLLRVAPGDPDGSYLVHKLEGTAGIIGDRMPQGGPFLDQATIDQVRAWIAAGAENN